MGTSPQQKIASTLIQVYNQLTQWLCPCQCKMWQSNCAGTLLCRAAATTSANDSRDDGGKTSQSVVTDIFHGSVKDYSQAKPRSTERGFKLPRNCLKYLRCRLRSAKAVELRAVMVIWIVPIPRVLVDNHLRARSCIHEGKPEANPLLRRPDAGQAGEPTQRAKYDRF